MKFDYPVLLTLSEKFKREMIEDTITSGLLSWFYYLGHLVILRMKISFNLGRFQYWKLKHFIDGTIMNQKKLLQKRVFFIRLFILSFNF